MCIVGTNQETKVAINSFITENINGKNHSVRKKHKIPIVIIFPNGERGLR